jgi:hypothetical protein
MSMGPGPNDGTATPTVERKGFFDFAFGLGRLSGLGGSAATTPGAASTGMEASGSFGTSGEGGERKREREQRADE